jgi:hypothetical protein
MDRLNLLTTNLKAKVGTSSMDSNYTLMELIDKSVIELLLNSIDVEDNLAEWLRRMPALQAQHKEIIELIILNHQSVPYTKYTAISTIVSDRLNVTTLVTLLTVTWLEQYDIIKFGEYVE